MGEITKNDCQGEHMSDDEITINIEFGSAGLYYGTRPQMKGLLVTGESIKEVVDRVPNAIAEMRAVTAMGPEIERLRSELKQAREIIGFYADEANWRARGHPQIDADTTPVSQDGGGRARAFLKDYEDV